ncbi:NAD(P)-binding protein [Setomelanomma holmii]|uniref:NAD(P)-binding protein n=1 Tax=Setomelanomma holmii TaxID=210430 RepID=A0A9P4H2G9_9PLEO|nr:NAD(P)-binding protein [Setomelanomma holmii]
MKSVLITGCTDGGIGSVLALTFAQRGLLVFAAARKLAKMANLSNLPNVKLLELDVTDRAQVQAAVALVRKETGGTLDYLVNNAGQTRYLPLLDEDSDFEEAKAVFDTNVWGQLRMVQAFVPLLTEAKGTLVYISSTYAASKRAAEIMFDTLRLELKPFGISVTSVVTGPVKSQIHSHMADLKLPEKSLYADVEDTIKKRAGGDDGAPRMDTQKYTDTVVNKILGGGQLKVWCGANMWLVNLMGNWVPSFIADKLLVFGTGIDVMLKRK